MKISVIIPTFNRAFCILRALESVLEQTYLAHEILVIDDGSTDATRSLLKDLPIEYFFQANKGVSSARNTGIRKSSGDWIAFLDSDDAWHKKKLEFQIKELKKTGCKLCHSDEAWIRNGKWINPKKHLLKSNTNLFKRSLERCCISPSSVLICKKVLFQLGLFDENLKIAEDYDMWLKFTVQYKTSFVDKKLVTRYAGHNNQLSNISDIQKYQIQSLKQILDIKILTTMQREIIKKELFLKQAIFTKGEKNAVRMTY